MKLFAPAKINLHLSIVGRRPDGYHDLVMLMEKISLCDEIVLEKIPEGIDFPDPTNLVYRAAALLQQRMSDTYGGDNPDKCPTPTGGVRITLYKRIPTGAGLGGGSSDAAAVLKGLNELWDLHWPVARLAEIGVQLGADVPFFLYDGPAIVEGIGDTIIPCKQLPKLWILLIYPGVSVSTPKAYAQWDESRQKRLTPNQCDVMAQSLERFRRHPADFGDGYQASFAEVLSVLHNDFEEVILPLHPEISSAKEQLIQVGVKKALMSGSGSAVFGLFETEEARNSGEQKLKTEPGWQVFAVENGE